MISKLKRTCAEAAAIAVVSAATSLGSQPGQAHERESAKPVFEHALPNVPGKSLIAVVVRYAPGGKSPAHHHAGSAFIYAYVLTGEVRSRVGDEPAKVYRAGESFFEEPGAHHRMSENASESEPASLLAVFIVDGQDRPLTVPDPDAARP
ncbi:cupin domain-containing protein [Methylobacterium sp. P1-11]|uniref:cupin domain-containing protein n=1 Tax=Methylobacterium sp. P1-11 TaxID=2024616 RepID=UPI0011EFC7DC|nr:cupin domain-containing protein [Methylobacterium sp. P1-11]KAA0116705.1 cupin domain-containing protein [Methylobacterium sp. P1-11]